MKELEKWQKKYNMTKKEWEEPYFKDLIGGIKSTKKEQNDNYLEIKNATLKNYKGELVELKKETILRSYPRSINLLKSYYNSLAYAHRFVSGNRYKKYTYFNLGNNKTWEDILIEDRNTMLMIYAPYFEELSLKELEKYTKEFDLSMDEMNTMILKYRVLNSIKDKDNNEKKDLLMIRRIVNEISVNNCTKESIAQKHKIDLKSVDKYIEQIKDFDMKTYNKIINKLIENEEKNSKEIQYIIESIDEYIIKGIAKEGKKSPFTPLDFYSICNKDPQEIIQFINNSKDIKSKRNRVTRYLSSIKNVGIPMTAESFANKKIIIIANDKKTEFDIELSEKLINLLNDNNIPTYYEIVYTAAKRYARGESIFPLKTPNEIEEREIHKNNSKIKRRSLESL